MHCLLILYTLDKIEVTSDNILVSNNIGQGSEDSRFLFMTTSC